MANATKRRWILKNPERAKALRQREYKARAATRATGKVTVCEDLRCIYVTGQRVKLTAEMLAKYQTQLERRFMCGGCGETFGINRPKRCSKCGSGSFELAAARR